MVSSKPLPPSYRNGLDLSHARLPVLVDLGEKLGSEHQFSLVGLNLRQITFEAVADGDVGLVVRVIPCWPSPDLDLSLFLFPSPTMPESILGEVFVVNGALLF
jgi:hypothetical protein